MRLEKISALENSRAVVEPVAVSLASSRAMKGGEEGGGL
jgi:hypothetical protein